MIALTLVTAFFVLILIGAPIAVALGGSAMVASMLFSPIPDGIVGQKLFANLNHFTLMAIPFFFLAAGLMEQGGLGANIPRARLLLILIAGTATGVATIFVGPLSFVGLMAPHMASRAGFHRASQHLHATALIGTCLMVCADFGARMAGFPYELPLGLFASLIGAPWLMATLSRKTG